MPQRARIWRTPAAVCTEAKALAWAISSLAHHAARRGAASPSKNAVSDSPLNRRRNPWSGSERRLLEHREELAEDLGHLRRAGAAAAVEPVGEARHAKELEAE